MDDNDNDVSMNTLNDNDDDPILTATITFDVTVDPTGQVISTSEGQIVTESVVQNALDGRLTTLSDHHQAMALAAVNAAAVAAAANEHHARSGGGGGGGMQADSLSSMNSASQHKEITATLHDSLDDDHDSDNDDTSSTSTESLIERSKKYMDKEAGIIILKRDNMPQNNFNINLDFGIRPSATPGESNRHAATTQESRSIAAEALNKNFNINVDFGLRPTAPATQNSSDTPTNRSVPKHHSSSSSYKNEYANAKVMNSYYFGYDSDGSNVFANNRNRNMTNNTPATSSSNQSNTIRMQQHSNHQQAPKVSHRSSDDFSVVNSNDFLSPLFNANSSSFHLPPHLYATTSKLNEIFFY